MCSWALLSPNMQWLWRSRLWLFFPIVHGLIVLRQPILWLFCLIAVSCVDALSYDNWSYHFIAFSFTDISSYDNRSYRFTAISTWHPQSYSLCPMAPWSYGLTVCIMILHSHNGITNDQGLRTRPTLPHTYMSYHTTCIHIHVPSYSVYMYTVSYYNVYMCTYLCSGQKGLEVVHIPPNNPVCEFYQISCIRGVRLACNIPEVKCRDLPIT